MKVEIFRLAGSPISIEVTEGATVRDVLEAPGGGRALGYAELSLMDAAMDVYGSVERLGSFRVNGAPADLATPVTEGATLLIIPKVEGGLAG